MTILFLKSACILTHDVWDIYASVANALCSYGATQVQDLILASPSEVAREVQGLCNRFKCQVADVVDLRSGQCNMEKLLTIDEHRRLRQYRDMCYPIPFKTLWHYFGMILITLNKHRAPHGDENDHFV